MFVLANKLLYADESSGCVIFLVNMYLFRNKPCKFQLAHLVRETDFVKYVSVLALKNLVSNLRNYFTLPDISVYLFISCVQKMVVAHIKE